VLPKLIFEPLLRRFDQRTADTEGARAEARRTLADADAQVALFERAMSDEKQRALAERAADRMQAQREAAELVKRVRSETAARIDAGVSALRQEGERGRAALDAEAASVAKLIVGKILGGSPS
jgi:F0F1-type ATP synthase membrane subunit b/b'